MPTPLVATYSPAALAAAHTAFLALLDTGTGNGKLRVRSSVDVLLSTINFTDPAGSVNGTTGQLTLTVAGPDTNAAAGGNAAYVEICDVANNVLLAMPVQSGTVAVSGVAVLNTLAIVAGGTVSALSVIIG